MGSDVPPLDAGGQFAQFLRGARQMRIQFQSAAIELQGASPVAIFVQHVGQFVQCPEMPGIELYGFLQAYQRGCVVIRRMLQAGANVPAFGISGRDAGDGIDQLLGGRPCRWPSSPPAPV